jgi:iron(III) transport system substrate-binding protein
MRTRKTLLTAALAALMLIPAACGSDDSDTLTVYSGRDEELVAPLFEDFAAESGVELDVRYGETPELASTIVEEGDASPADIFFSQDAGALGLLQKENLLAGLPTDVLEEVPAAFRSAQGDWVGVSARARIVAYNRDAVADADLPDSVLELTDERYGGKVGWAPGNASFQSFVTGLRRVEGEQAAEQWLRDMTANDTQVYEDNSSIRDAIASGELDYGLINHYYVAEAQAEEGPGYPVAIHEPTGGDAGALVNVAGVGVLESSESKGSAEELIAFLLSPEAQKFFASETKEYPVVEGIAADGDLVPLADIEQPDIDLNDLDDLRGTAELLQRTGVL